jgi:hypothetical protein
MEFILEVVGYFIIYAMELPGILILSTPVILIKSFFGKQSYLKNMRESYGKIINFCKEKGPFVW